MAEVDWAAYVLKKIISALFGPVAKAVIPYLQRLPKNVREFWNGKKIAIIGATASGKDSFFNRLQGKPFSETYNQTRTPEKIENFQINYGMPDGTTFKLVCKRAGNVGGEEDQKIDYWFQACADSDIIFYLIDSKELLNIDPNKNSTNRVKSDIKWIATHMSKFHAQVKIQILFNKLDLMIDYSDHKAEIPDNLTQRIKEIQTYSEQIFGVYNNKLCTPLPISMLDDHLYNIYLANAFIEIANCSEKIK